MTTKSPIALFIFSNDLDNKINVETERKSIQKILQHYEDRNILKVITYSFVSTEELFELLVVGGTDGTERVTHENTGGKLARSRMIFLGAWQTDGGRGRQ